MLQSEVLILKFVTVDGLPTGSVVVCEIATLQTFTVNLFRLEIIRRNDAVETGTSKQTGEAIVKQFQTLYGDERLP